MTSEAINGRNQVQVKNMNEEGKLKSPVKQYKKYRKEIVYDYEKEEGDL